MWKFWHVRTAATAIPSNAVQTNRLRNDALLSELSHDLAVTRGILLTAFAIGLLAVVAMCVFHVIQHGYVVFFWALACFAGGSLIGFLFGIPRVFQRQGEPDAMGTNVLPGTGSFAGPSRPGYQLVINTHLDDISD
jgi:ABC-type transport system involved in cytochrome bd biosynthesis fused ATPase/permease subunit